MKIVDISLPLDAGYRMQTPDGVKDIQIEFEIIKEYPGGAGQYVSAVHMRLHNGTHVDAPMHFVEGGSPISGIPLSTFYGEGVMADVTSVGEGNPIQAADLERAFGDRDLTGKRIFIRTNWNHHYGEPDYDERSPYIALDAIDWVVSKAPALVSYDYAHGKDDPDAPARFHPIRTFLSNGIVTMGYVRNLDQIDASRPFTVSAFPLAFVGVESSPVRAVLIQD